MASADVFETALPVTDRLIENVESLQRLGDYTTALALRAVCSLGIADYLADGPRPVNELAAASGTSAPALHRVLRALAAVGVFEETAPGLYSLGGPAELLRSDHRFSMHDAYQLWPLHVRAWTAFEYSIRTGKAAFERVHGVDHRRFRADHPEEDSRMDRAHRAATNADLLTLTRVYDWSTGVRLIVDVGGGTGAFLVGLLTRFKQLRGVLFDMPRMIARSAELLSGSAVQGRIETVPGDFFDSVPADGDLYVLKAVLGGWIDESAVLILRTVRAAMRAGSRLLVIEPILQSEERFTMGNMVHLQTLVLYGGPERSREDYEALAVRAGLRVNRVIPRATLSILELTPC